MDYTTPLKNLLYFTGDVILFGLAAAAIVFSVLFILAILKTAGPPARKQLELGSVVAPYDHKSYDYQKSKQLKENKRIMDEKIAKIKAQYQ